MKKIISLFQRNYETDRLVRDEVVPGAEWVLAGEGVATIKFDGVCTMVRDGKVYKRYELKPGKTAPSDWEAADDVDETTGKQMGWVPVGDGPEDKYLRECAIPNFDCTCEFLGPKSQGNVEGIPAHVLLPHELAERLPDAPRDFNALREYLSSGEIEGIVWHHPDGRMVKIKAKDFGFKRFRSNPAKGA